MKEKSLKTIAIWHLYPGKAVDRIGYKGALGSDLAPNVQSTAFDFMREQVDFLSYSF